jgi:1-acyl-sn-glycerol-3-phosphate acyltransferase
VRDPDFSTRWALGALILYPVVRLLFRLRVEGVDHVPLEGPAIIAFNHTSVLDGPVVAIVTARRRRRKIRFLIAAEIVASGLAGLILRAFDQIPVHRGQQDAGAIDQALDSVSHGAVIALAPEGRLNEDDAYELLRIKSGVARLALPTQAPIVPLGLSGTNTLWPKSGARWARVLRRPRLAMIYGPPLVPHGSADDQGDIDALRQRVRTSLETQVARARAVAEPPG